MTPEQERIRRAMGVTEPRTERRHDVRQLQARALDNRRALRARARDAGRGSDYDRWLDRIDRHMGGHEDHRCQVRSEGRSLILSVMGRPLNAGGAR